MMASIDRKVSEAHDTWSTDQPPNVEQLARSADIRRARRKDVGETVVQAERDEDAHGDEREQLDDRFERDRGYQPFVALGSVEVAGAEQDGEAASSSAM